MSTFTDKSVTALLDAFSSPDPTPGGGSASALAGALGVSLLAMVAGLPKTKTGTPEARAELDAVRERLMDVRATLVELVDRDAASYDQVVAAYRLPKATLDEQTARKAAIQVAMRGATDVPLETMRACAEALKEGIAIAEHGLASAKSDVAVGVGLLMQGLQGGFYNVEANIGSLTDQIAVASIVDTSKSLLTSAGGSIRLIYQTPSMTELVKAAAARTGHGKI